MFKGSIMNFGTIIILVVLAGVFFVANQPPSLIDSNDNVGASIQKPTGEMKSEDSNLNLPKLRVKDEINMVNESFNILPKSMEKALKRLVAKSQLDDNGQLILNAKMQSALKQFHITSDGPINKDQKEYISKYVYSLLSSDAAYTLVNVIDLYFVYKTEEKLFMEKNTHLTRLEVLYGLNIIREESLGYEYSKGLFLERSAKTEYHLKIAQIQQNSYLSAAEKNAQLSQLKTIALQKNIINPYPVNQQLSQLKKEVSTLRSQGVSEEVVHQTRVNSLGERDAQDLLEQEAYMVKWNKRYERYYSERQLILDSGLDEVEKNKQLESILNLHYQENEVASIRAYNKQQTKR